MPKIDPEKDPLPNKPIKERKSCDFTPRTGRGRKTKTLRNHRNGKSAPFVAISREIVYKFKATKQSLLRCSWKAELDIARYGDEVSQQEYEEYIQRTSTRGMWKGWRDERKDSIKKQEEWKKHYVYCHLVQCNWKTQYSERKYSFLKWIDAEEYTGSPLRVQRSAWLKKKINKRHHKTS